MKQSGGLYSHAIQRIYVSYDLNRANWRSAVYQPDYYNDIVRFEIYGEMGLREMRYDHNFENEDELRIGVGFLGLSVGPQKDIKIQLPNYMTKERYDRAYLDLTAQCPEFPADTKMPTRPIRTNTEHKKPTHIVTHRKARDNNELTQAYASLALHQHHFYFSAIPNRLNCLVLLCLSNRDSLSTGTNVSQFVHHLRNLRVME